MKQEANECLSRTIGEFSSGMENTDQQIKQRPRIDITLLASIPIILAALHFLLPATVYTDLWFYYSDPSILSAWTAAYTHGSNQHLLSNIGAYVLTVSVAYYLLTVVVKARSVFWGTIAALLLVTPLLTTAVDYGLLYKYYEVFPSDADSKGFSGIVGGFAGMTLGGIGVYVARQYGVWPGIHTVVGVGLAGVGVLSVVHGTFSAKTGALLFIAFAAISALYISIEDVKNGYQIRKTLQAHNELVTVIIGFGMIVCGLVYALIPVDVMQSGSFVNVFAHGIGFVFGTLMTGIVAAIVHS